MGDDGVAIYMAEELKKGLENNGIEVIIGETDLQYCISRVNEGDFLFILDASYFGNEPGTVTLNPIEIICHKVGNQSFYSQHALSIIKMLGIYAMKVQGFVIGIEGEKFEFGLTLSKVLKERFKSLCSEVDKIIYQYL